MDPKLWHFNADVSSITLPKKFTYPFYYDTHPLADHASQQLMQYLKTKDFGHNFGLNPEKNGIIQGKMFGVLVVEHPEHGLRFLAAFSGKLGDKNHHRRFVPPVFDRLEAQGYFNLEEEKLNAITNEIEKLQNSLEYNQLREDRSHLKRQCAQEMEEYKQQMAADKEKRDKLRKQGKNSLNSNEYSSLENKLSTESRASSFALKDLQRKHRSILEEADQKVRAIESKIEGLRNIRKEGSQKLQQWLFEQYSFLNAKNERKDLNDIFGQTALKIPPSGAGDCSAPKLLQYAYDHDLKPICMAEFWWGASPKSRIRHHARYYPACKGKCEPILGHMLGGMDVDPDPINVVPDAQLKIKLIYEDADMAVIRKPANLLSTPGRKISESAQTQFERMFPRAECPKLVHRLDMSTSGIMIGAKTERAYRQLQRQFIQRTAKKRYVALLEKDPKTKNGQIDLPLSFDYLNRPRQFVCFDTGKEAITEFELLGEEKLHHRTVWRVHFLPLTGRTHQLRVHAAHEDGLDAPIVGDDLYGFRSDRLYLHAEWIRLRHPSSSLWIEFQDKVPF